MMAGCKNLHELSWLEAKPEDVGVETGRSRLRVGVTGCTADLDTFKATENVNIENASWESLLTGVLGIEYIRVTKDLFNNH